MNDHRFLHSVTPWRVGVTLLSPPLVSSAFFMFSAQCATTLSAFRTLTVFCSVARPRSGVTLLPPPRLSSPPPALSPSPWFTQCDPTAQWSHTVATTLHIFSIPAVSCPVWPHRAVGSRCCHQPFCFQDFPHFLHSVTPPRGGVTLLPPLLCLQHSHRLLHSVIHCAVSHCCNRPFCFLDSLHLLYSDPTAPPRGGVTLLQPPYVFSIPTVRRV